MKTKKIVAFIMLIITLLSTFSNIVYASTEISSADLKDRGDCGFHLQFWDTNQNAWSYIITTFVTYDYNGIEYPAYCLNRELPGVSSSGVGDYAVNIENVLEDVRVWRVIINGYPYQSPANMGLENKYDAFVATKQAVYCILYDFDPVTRYNGGDARGVAIKNAIINLTNIGRYGTQTPNTTDIEANKVGEFYEDGEYYSQNYIVNSPVDMSQYNIIGTANLPNGSKITDLSNNEKSVFSGNEQFKVRIPKSQLISDLNVSIVLRAKCKTYPVFYGKTTVAGTQNYAVTFDPYGDIAGQTNLNVKTNTGILQINKTDDETKEPIPGVTFQLYSNDGKVIANATTNDKGIATFSGLYQGNYKLKEVLANDNYILNTSVWDINVEYNKSVSVDITNEHKKGDLKIYKVDKDNNHITLGNVEFQLYSDEFKKTIGTYYTDVNGEISIANLRTGNYKLIETKTNRWYNLAEDTDVEIKWNKTTNETIENELKKGQIKIIKVDKDNTEVKLQGIEFEVLDNDNNVLEKIVTDENGEALTSRYAVRDYSNLKIREYKTLDNYVLNDEIKTITLHENQIDTIVFHNEKKKGQIKVIKVDLDNQEVKIPNVEFKVFDEIGNIVDTLITDENGEATSIRLPIDQQYKVQETKTGKWYVLNDNPQTAVLKQDEITSITFTNEKKKGQIKIIKVDKDNNEVLLQGVTFDIVDEKGTVVDRIVTDENGEAITKRLPIDEQYIAVEKQTNKEYVLTEETQKVELKQDEIKTITFENEKIKGYVEITKVDEKTNEVLKDAVFGIFNSNDEQVGTLTTGEDGKAKSELLPYGKYYVQELDTGSVYYLLNENKYDFEILENHVVIPLTIENEGVEIEVTVDKKGTTEIKPGEIVNYEFSNVGNASNVYLDNFKWFDYIPTDYIRLQKMTTGTWNQDLSYDVYYKTNKSDEYVLFREKLNTKENYDLDFTTIEFADDEYIVETMFDFGTVDIGFKEDVGPTMECISLEELQDKQTFTNKTKTIGTYFAVTAESDSKWTTIVHKPEEKHEVILPKTGK